MCAADSYGQWKRILVVKVVPDPEEPGTLLFSAPPLDSIWTNLQRGPTLMRDMGMLDRLILTRLD